MPRKTERMTQSPAETQQLGVSLARVLKPGDCVALRGDLGSGKTCLAQGICLGLSVKDHVTSPTFVLINEYSGVGMDGKALPIYHFDLYRLGDPEELYMMGCDDYFYGTGVCIIEWADLGGAFIPTEAIDIHLLHAGHSSRKVIISGRSL